MFATWVVAILFPPEAGHAVPAQGCLQRCFPFSWCRWPTAGWGASQSGWAKTGWWTICLDFNKVGLWNWLKPINIGYIYVHRKSIIRCPHDVLISTCKNLATLHTGVTGSGWKNPGTWNAGGEWNLAFASSAGQLRAPVPMCDLKYLFHKKKYEVFFSIFLKALWKWYFKISAIDRPAFQPRFHDIDAFESIPRLTTTAQFLSEALLLGLRIIIFILGPWTRLIK